MAETIASPSQLFPAAGVRSDLYTVPVNTRAVVSSLVACNQTAMRGQFSLSVAVAGAVDEAKQYLYRQQTIGPYSTFVATLGGTLGPGDVVRVWSDNGHMA